MSEPFAIARSPLPQGLARIEASAGTGKTWSIAHLVVRAVIDGSITDPGQVLVVTFTEAATAELAGRVRLHLQAALTALAGDAPVYPYHDLAQAAGVDAATACTRLAAALVQADLLAVRTIHGFCHQVLAEDAFASRLPFTCTLLADDRMLVESVIADRWRRDLASHPWLAALAAVEHWSVAEDRQAWVEFDRHPGTRFLPEVSLPVVTAAADAAIAAVVRTCDAPAITAAFAAASWSKAKESIAQVRGITGPSLVQILDAVQAASDPQAPRSALVEAVRAVTSERLDKLLLQKPADARRQVLELPWVAACTALGAALAPMQAAWRRQLFAALAGDLATAKQQAQALTYDDLLRRVQAALAGPGGAALAQGLRQRYRLVLIDEFQDTDAVQWDIFHRAFVAGGVRTIVVGDPKQAIYGFRGGDVATYLAAARSAQAGYTLAANQRSEAPLVAAVNQLFQRVPEAFAVPGLEFHPAEPGEQGQRRQLSGWPGARFRWWLAESGTHIPTVCATHLRHLFAQGCRIDGRALHPGDCAVLVRSNRQAVEVHAALTGAGIPAVIADSGDVLESDAAGELASMLGATLAPRDAGVVRAALATRLWGVDAVALAGLDAAGWDGVLDRLLAWSQTLRRQGVAAWWQRLTTDLGVVQRLLSQPGGERRLTDCRHLVELLHRRVAGGEDVADALRWMRGAARGDERDERLLRLETDAAAVQVVTMHHAKGLQYGVVLCPYLWDPPKDGLQAWCTARLDDQPVFDHGDDARVRAARRAEDLAEHLRLIYVALTRARHLTWVLWGALGDVHGRAWRRSGLAWLLRHGAWAGLARDDWLVEAHAKKAEQRLPDPDPGQWLVEAVATMPDHAVDPLPNPEAPAYTTTTAAVTTPVVLSTPAVPPPRITTSFTGLTAVAHERGDTADARRGEPGELESEALRGFAAGADAGVCLHGILEHWDGSGDAAWIRRQLELHAFADPAQHGGTDPVPVVGGLLHHLDASIVPGLGRWSELRTCTQAREFRFSLPLRRATGTGLAQAFAAHGHVAYARRLAQLPGASLPGLLSGVIDVVIQGRDGRWWIIDWKSNRIAGTSLASAVAALMEGEHYLLQAHLYLVALHRLLRLRQPEYALERHLGGWAYAFLRGLRAGSSDGWCCGDADPGLILALDDLLEAPHAAS